MITTHGPKPGSVGLELVHQNGGTLTRHSHNNQLFVEAPTEGSYVLRLKNNSSRRKLVVISVDGRNVMDGKTASYDGQGYVLNAWQSAEIKGWRRTEDEVAAFEFVDISKSYEVQTGGSGSNVGVIGVAVFDEKEQYRYWKSPQFLGGLEGINNDFGDASASTLSSSNLRSKGVVRKSKSNQLGYAESVGTGYGKKTAMKTTSTSFDKASDSPSQVISMRYAAESMLRKWGVIADPIIPSVNPFPEESVAVTAPPGWNG